MLKLVLLFAILAAASAQYISPYISNSYISPLYRNNLYGGFALPYAYNYNYGYGLSNSYGLGYNYNLLYR